LKAIVGIGCAETVATHLIRMISHHIEALNGAHSMPDLGCGPAEPAPPEPGRLDPRIRALIWAQLPARGFMALEMRCLRRFLEDKGLWDDYLRWATREEP
jgi:hypothetical protein